VALTVLLLDEGPGDVGGADAPSLHDWVGDLRAFLGRVAAGRPTGRTSRRASAASEARVGDQELAREEPPLPDPTAGRPDEPPF